jgi:hypothetical protein
VEYVKFDNCDIAGIDRLGLAHLIVEVREDGTVMTEVGLDARGRVVHRCPGAPSMSGSHGLFDLTPVKVEPGSSTMTREEFMSLWLKREDAD